MTELLVLIPILACLATMLVRVAVIRGAKVEGREEATIPLRFSERLRYHRASLYALGALLLMNAAVGTLPTSLELLAIVAAWGIVSVPVRYRLTSQGIALNHVVFRRWSEFRGYRAERGRVRLLGKPGNARFDIRLPRERQAVALAAVGRRLGAASVAKVAEHGRGRRKLPVTGMAVVAMLALGLALAASPALADGPDSGPKVDPTGLTVGAPEDLGGIAVGGGSLSVTQPDGTPDADATAKVFTDAKSREPFAYNLAAYVNQNRLAINMVWVLITGYLVMFMQAGFALVETGFCRVKNAMHVMMTNFMVYGLGMIAYWAIGFALQFGGVGLTGPTNLGAGLLALDKEATIHLFGNDWGLFGYKGFFLGPNVLDVGIAALFLFQMVFMDTAATILTGAAAERWRWAAFCIWGLVIGGFIYPMFGNWAWGGGWLFQLKDSVIGRPYVDFAGSGVVHAVGGWSALAAAWVLGPRLGKYNRDGTSNAMPGHNLNMAVLGCFILAFGWFGFNPGSTLGAAGGGNLRIAEIAVVTMLAGAASSITAMLYAKWTLGKYDPGYMMNGLLAGLVAITAPSGYVSPISAVAIGGIAGVLVCVAMVFVDQKLKIDDPVGAFSVHGACGLWGVISVGLFADGTAPDYLVVGHPIQGLLFGDASQLVAQLVGVVTVIVWAGGASLVLFGILKALGVLRSDPADEIAGLDLPEMGTHAYPIQDAGTPTIILEPGGGASMVPLQA